MNTVLDATLVAHCVIRYVQTKRFPYGVAGMIACFLVGVRLDLGVEMNRVRRRLTLRTRLAVTAFGLLFAVSLVNSVPASGQALALIRGTVTDPSGAAVATAIVHLISATTNADRTATTDQRGAYSFLDVAPGPYRLEVDAPGFQKYELPELRLQAGPSIVQDVKLQLEQVQQSVLVTGRGADQNIDQCLAAQKRILPDVGPGLRAFRRGPSGNYYALTAPGNAAAIYSPNGTRIGQIPAQPTPDASIGYGSDLQLDSAGRVFIADRAANAIKIYSADGNLAGKFHVTAPISVEPLAAGEVAVASLSSKHLVDVYDSARGEIYRSFGDVAQSSRAECDTVTLRCTLPENTGELSDAARLKQAEATLNRTWFYGDSAGNVYVNLDAASDPTIRKYDSYGYLAFESPFPLSRADFGSGNSGWVVNPEVRLAGIGTVGAYTDTSQYNSTNSAYPSGDPNNTTDQQISGGQFGAGGGTGGGMHGGGGMGGGMRMEGGGGAPGMEGGGGHGGMRGGGMNMNRMTFGVRFTERGGAAAEKPVIDAMGVDPTNQDVWAAIGGNLVHFDKDGRLAGFYCLSTSDQTPVRPTTMVVEPDRILLGTDPFGIFQYPRPDKPLPVPNPATSPVTSPPTSH